MGKKWIALLMAAAMVFSLGMTAFAEEAVEEEEEIVVPPELITQMGYSGAWAVSHGVNPDDIVYYNHITVGNTTNLKGDFFTNMWGNTTSDIDVRLLLHGYNLVRWDGSNGMFTVDPSVVEGIVVTENDAEDRTYTMALRRDLQYSDGSPITAWDYAFSFLLEMSPAVKLVGAVPMQKEFLIGSEDYSAGRTNVLTGVRVTDDYTIAITLDHEYLPFFYEMGLLSCYPYPISVIAPGSLVRDDGNGVHLDRGFTPAMLENTINDPATGYRTHPSVVSGPYTLVSFDGTTAEFERNPYFHGTAYGEMPLIEKLTYTLAENGTMMDKLESGEFDLLNKVTNAESISRGMTLIPGGSVGMANYPRSGLMYLVFACEKPTVSSAKVRQAFAYCMDRDAVVSDYTGNFGIRVDGYYGVGQWMYGVVNRTVAPPVEPPENQFDEKARDEYEKELKAWEELSLDKLNDYTLDTEKANLLLLQDGWKLNADGIREKMILGEKVTLNLTLVYPAGNRIVEILEQHLVPNLEQVGIRLTMKPVPMGELTDIAYSAGNRDADIIFQASNFDMIFDPSVYFEVVDGQTGEWSFSAQTDGELYRRALVMRETEPGDVLSYMQKWVSFQERVNEQLPILPIYSNVYFDFFTNLLHDYDISESSTWGEASIGAVKAEIPKVEIEEADLDGGKIEIG